MRLFILAALLCVIVAGGPAVAQPAVDGRRPAAGPARYETSNRERDEDAAAVANCVSMWDAATHMTRQQWLRACRRVQSRLRTLQVR